MRRLARLTSLALSFTLGLFGLGATAAVAVDANEPGILLSFDQTDWQETLAHDLFDDSIRWVPGDQRTETFWLKNNGPVESVVSVVSEGSGTEDLIEMGDIDVDLRVDGGAWGTLESLNSQLERAGFANAGAVSRVDVRVVFSADSPNYSQVQSLDFNLVIRLTQNAPIPPQPPTIDPKSHTGLTVTGGQAIGQLAIIGLLGAIVGVFFLVKRRREREQEQAAQQ